MKDNSGGFKCYRRSVLEGIDLDNFISKGYSIGAEMLHYCYLQNFTMKEIPIIFRNRELGKSKQNIKVILAYPLDILRIRYFPKIRYKKGYVKYAEIKATFYDEQIDKAKSGSFRAWYHISRYHLLQQLVSKYSNNLSRIVDMGCGSCNWNNKAVPVTGIDLNTNLLNHALKKKRIDKPICCDIKKLSLKKESVDIIIASEILEHIDGLNNFIQECWKLLNPRGKMIITVPYDFIGGPFYVLFHIHCFIQGYIKGDDYYKRQCGHINHFTKRKIRRIFTNNGFRIRDIFIFNYFLIVAVVEKE